MIGVPGDSAALEKGEILIEESNGKAIDRKVVS
jgi:hypothetical protein